MSSYIKEKVPACAANTDENKENNLQLNDTSKEAENQPLNGKILFDRIFEDMVVLPGPIDEFVDSDPAVKHMHDQFYCLFDRMKNDIFRLNLEETVTGLLLATQQAAALYGMRFANALQEAGARQNEFIKQKIEEFQKG